MNPLRAFSPLRVNGIVPTLPLLLALLVASSCSRPPSETPNSKPKIPNSLAIASAHPLRGEIVRVDPARQVLLVHHEEIPGYMPAMTMEFHLAADASVSAFQEGQRISARMIEIAPGYFRLENVLVLDPRKEAELAAAARALREDTHILGKSAYREIGETVPSFALYNQDGAIVRFDRFRGQRVILNFIFTRCPVPTMCPAATGKMMALQAAVKKAGIREVEFVSISFDSAYDTPPVLKAYATARGIDTTNFSFLTGPEAAIADLLRQFGVYAIPGENLYRHTLATILIGPDGKIIHRTDDSEWNPEDFLRRL